MQLNARSQMECSDHCKCGWTQTSLAAKTALEKGRYREASNLSQRTVELALSTNQDPRRICSAFSMYGSALLGLGQRKEAEDAFVKALQYGGQIQLEDEEFYMYLLIELGLCRMQYQDRIDDTLPLLEKAINICKRKHLPINGKLVQTMCAATLCLWKKSSEQSIQDWRETLQKAKTLGEESLLLSRKLHGKNDSRTEYIRKIVGGIDALISATGNA